MLHADNFRSLHPVKEGEEKKEGKSKQRRSCQSSEVKRMEESICRRFNAAQVDTAKPCNVSAQPALIQKQAFASAKPYGSFFTQIQNVHVARAENVLFSWEKQLLMLAID